MAGGYFVLEVALNKAELAESCENTGVSVDHVVECLQRQYGELLGEHAFCDKDREGTIFSPPLDVFIPDAVVARAMLIPHHSVQFYDNPVNSYRPRQDANLWFEGDMLVEAKTDGDRMSVKGIEVMVKDDGNGPYAKVTPK